MNLRSLMNKLDALNENVTSQDLNLAIAGTEQNEPERIKRLADTATKLNVSGVYDPISGNYVSKTGQVSDEGTKAQNLELAKLGLVTPSAHLGTAGVFDNDEVQSKYNQSIQDLSKWSSDRSNQQQSEINRISGMIDQYEKLKNPVKEYINFSKDLVESFGYNYDNELLSELTVPELKQAAKDFGRGVASGATLGYAPEIAAKIRSATGNISYEDALKQELAKNEIAKKRSPWLYDAGSLAPGVVGGIPGAALTAADFAFGKDDLANPFSSDDAPEEEQPTDDQTSSEPTPTEPEEQPEVTEKDSETQTTQIQQSLVKQGYDVGTTGADGKFGPNTVAAIKQYTSENNLDNDSTAIAKLLGLTQDMLKQTTGKLSESEHMSLLLDTLSRIDEAGIGSVLKGLKKAGKFSSKAAPVSKSATKAAPVTKATSKVVGGAAKSSLLSKIGNIVGPATKWLWNHKFLSLVAALGIYGYAFDSEGNIVSPNMPSGGSDHGGSHSADPHSAKPQATQATQEPQTTQEPQQATSQTSASDLNMLKSQIDIALKYASGDSAPDVQKQLDALKARWTTVSK